jgi:hypothetical protein
MNSEETLNKIAREQHMLLQKYAGAYKGSPYLGEAEAISQRYATEVTKQDELNSRKVSSWDELESAIKVILFDDRFSLSEVNDKASEIIQLVQRCGISAFDKLDRIRALIPPP